MKFVALLLFATYAFVGAVTEEDHGVRYANRCETCKILATELQERLKETGKSHDVIEIGYSLDDVKTKKRTEYRRSELRLLESIENVCNRVLEYNLHKERTDSTRFAKGMPQTFQALHGLVNKGVKVDLGIPYELWDKPPVEVAQMKTQCEDMLEEYEDVISDWYFKEQQQEERTLLKSLCEEHVLTPDDRKCLTEELSSPKTKTNNDKKHENEANANAKVAKQKKSKDKTMKSKTTKTKPNETDKNKLKGDKDEL